MAELQILSKEDIPAAVTTRSSAAHTAAATEAVKEVLDALQEDTNQDAPGASFVVPEIVVNAAIGKGGDAEDIDKRIKNTLYRPLLKAEQHRNFKVTVLTDPTVDDNGDVTYPNGVEAAILRR